MIGLIGDFFGMIADAMELFSLPFALLMIVLLGGFTWFMLAKFWWKKDATDGQNDSSASETLGGSK
jgi:uncharacterized membrane protein